MKTLKRCLVIVALTLWLASGITASAQSVYLSPGMDPQALKHATDQARQKIKGEKVQIIMRNVFFMEDEAARFWPLFEEYLRALDLLLDERVGLLQSYAEVYHRMDDKLAEKLMEQVFDHEAKRTQLKRTWFKKFAKVVPRKKAAQFFQIENQVNAALDLQLASSLPLIQ